MFDQAWKDGKKVALPVCLPGHEMEFRLYTKQTEMEKSMFNIPEPTKSEKVDPAKGKCLIIVPGVVFDPDGNRIGYGGGYYDRFLAKYPDIPRVMLAYEMQKTVSVPYDGNDVPVNLVLTETDRYPGLEA